MMALATSHPHLIDRLPKPRGRLTADAPLGPQTWFRTGGPAEVLFRPADTEDLAAFLKALPADVPVTVLGVGSNLLVRDGGIKGVVIRLMRGFTGIAVEGNEVVAGAGAPDLNVALTARDHALAGLEFLSGIPGTIGGAVADECRRLWRRARGGPDLGRGRRPRRQGPHRVARPSSAFSYRHSSAPADWIFTSARLRADARRSARDRPPHRRDRFGARRIAAAQPHRRLDLRQSARPQGVGADRPRRLPRPAHRRRAGLREALQLPDQSRRRHRGRHRGAGRGSAAAACSRRAACCCNGKSAASE